MSRRRSWIRFFLPVLAGCVIAIGLLGAVSSIGPGAQAEPAAPLPLANIAKIAAGYGHTCALTTSGGVKCWGDNAFGQLGDGTELDRAEPVDVIGLQSGVTAISVAWHHSCAALAAGGVRCWGRINDGTLNDRTVPQPVAGLTDTVTALAAGDSHTCVVTGAGAVKCWGENDQGQLGDGTTEAHYTPALVATLDAGVTRVAAGAGYTCAVAAGGAVKCWGNNGFGQLGDGTTTQRTTPVQVAGLTSGMSNVTAGGEHTCTLSQAGGVKCWGLNNAGALGDGTTTPHTIPVDVAGLTGGARAVTAGGGHTCALTEPGGVRCWGGNWYGQLGDASRLSRTLPVETAGLTEPAIGIAAGLSHTCAVMNSGQVRCWGYNHEGQLGFGAPGVRLTPGPIVNLDEGTVRMAAGGESACAVTTQGGVKCWGANASGQLGTGDTAPQTAPVQAGSLTSGVREVAVGGSFACALMSTGGVECWGDNGYGQLGDGTTASRGLPGDVAALTTTVTALSAATYHACALTADGKVVCWGDNQYGQLGAGASAPHLTPAEVTGLMNAVGVSTGDSHTCAVIAGGQVECWGENGDGQLGDGTTISHTVPAPVSGITNALTVTVGTNHSCAVTGTGDVRCWGNNSLCQLADGTVESRSTPVTPFGLASVIAIDAGPRYTCAVTNAGAVKCWGENFNGMLGDGTTEVRGVPVAVAGLGNGAKSTAGTYSHNCVLMVNGGVQCWGANYSGQLGDNTAWRLTAVTVVGGAEPSTATPTHTPTATPTATSTATSTATPTATSIRVPGTQGDAQEVNDTCPQAAFIPANGESQAHTFHRAGDVDWVRFDAVAGRRYRVEAEIPHGSRADVVLELYEGCAGLPADRFDKAFAAGARLDYVSSRSATVYLRLTDLDPGLGGDQVSYRLAVHDLTARDQPGAAIVVAGRLTISDSLQPNIDIVARQAFTTLQSCGYVADDIYLLSADPSLPGTDAPAAAGALRAALVDWASSRLGPDESLTLYLVDHGATETFFLDEPHNERVSAATLNAWLTQLEAAVPDMKTNVIIETCHSGSFIGAPHALSKPGRVIITSSGAGQLAHASDQGAYFSDQFLTSLRQGRDLYASWRAAQEVVVRQFFDQTPWLDADGDGVPNEPADFAIAAQRGCALPKTLLKPWPPRILPLEEQPVVERYRVVIQVRVLDDDRVAEVWAVVYPPSYSPPTNGRELVGETQEVIKLQSKGGDLYASAYSGFTEMGTYRLAIYARDNDGLVSAPELIEVMAGHALFLPLVRR